MHSCRNINTEQGLRPSWHTYPEQAPLSSGCPCSRWPPMVNCAGLEEAAWSWNWSQNAANITTTPGITRVWERWSSHRLMIMLPSFYCSPCCHSFRVHIKCNVESRVDVSSKQSRNTSEWFLFCVWGKKWKTVRRIKFFFFFINIKSPLLNLITSSFKMHLRSLF